MSPLAALQLRAGLKNALRDFFGQRGYLEIDTPVGVTCPGTEVHLGYFRTEWRDFRGEARALHLRSSPELHMKQALALTKDGPGRLFQMGPCFRNDGELSPWHHPEFTMLEWYETGISFAAFVDQTEELLRETHARLAPAVARAGGTPLVLPRAFARFTVAEAFQQFARLTLIDGDPELATQAREAGVISVRPDDDFETAFFKVLLEKVEPALAAMSGAVLLDYPPSQAALASVNGGVAKRFEFYVGRVELCNGFEELLDLATNRARIRESLERRRLLGHEVPPEDEDFYAALATGLAPCCGNALGFDRWLALLMGDAELDHAVPFRWAKPYGPKPKG